MRYSRIAAVLLAGALFSIHASQASAQVLYVGDSLGVGTAAQLRLPHVDADTRVGRTSTEGLAVLRSRLRHRHRLVVFDLGTNDYSPPELTRNLRRARRLAPRRPMIVFTINKPGAPPFNAVLRRFAADARRITLIDWHSVAGARHLLAADGVHTDAGGYARRAVLLARAIRSRSGVGRFMARAGYRKRPTPGERAGGQAPRPARVARRHRSVRATSLNV
jgi:hypothetical protein